MSEAADHLADRIRQLLGDRPGIREQKMFGGVAFMLHGNMMVAPLKDGGLLVRVGKESYESTLARPGASPMTMSGRTMSGFIQVAGDAVEDDEDLAEWVEIADSYVKTLPPK